MAGSLKRTLQYQLEEDFTDNMVKTYFRTTILTRAMNLKYQRSFESTAGQRGFQYLSGRLEQLVHMTIHISKGL